MDITGVDKFRIGKEFPTVIDISPLTENDHTGLIAGTFLYEHDYKRKVEFRKKANRVALIVYYYGDSEIPEFWQDAEIIWAQDIEAYKK